MPRFEASIKPQLDIINKAYRTHDISVSLRVPGNKTQIVTDSPGAFSGFYVEERGLILILRSNNMGDYGSLYYSNYNGCCGARLIYHPILARTDSRENLQLAADAFNDIAMIMAYYNKASFISAMMPTTHPGYESARMFLRRWKKNSEWKSSTTQTHMASYEIDVNEFVAMRNAEIRNEEMAAAAAAIEADKAKKAKAEAKPAPKKRVKKVATGA